MKNIIASAALLFVINIVTAQTKFGFRIGANNSTAKVVDSSITQKSHYVQGFNAGVFLDVPFDGAFHFLPSINYSRRGYAFTHSSGPVRRTENNVHYIDIVPALSLNFALSKNKKNMLILGCGPMLSTAISGKQKDTYANDSVGTSKMIFNYSNFSRVDIGVVGSIGLKFNKLILESSYYYGLANVENDETLLRNIQGRMFTVTLGYFLK